MLILTRKPDQSILLLPGAALDPATSILGQMFAGQRVTITVLGLAGRHVRIGIDAPPSITVLRDEIYPHPLIRPQPSGRDSGGSAGFLVLSRRPGEALYLWPTQGSEDTPLVPLLAAAPLQVCIMSAYQAVVLGVHAPRVISILRDNAQCRDAPGITTPPL